MATHERQPNPGSPDVCDIGQPPLVRPICLKIPTRASPAHPNRWRSPARCLCRPQAWSIAPYVTPAIGSITSLEAGLDRHDQLGIMGFPGAVGRPRQAWRPSRENSSASRAKTSVRPPSINQWRRTVSPFLRITLRPEPDLRAVALTNGAATLGLSSQLRSQPDRHASARFRERQQSGLRSAPSSSGVSHALGQLEVACGLRHRDAPIGERPHGL